MNDKQPIIKKYLFQFIYQTRRPLRNGTVTMRYIGLDKDGVPYVQWASYRERDLPRFNHRWLAAPTGEGSFIWLAAKLALFFQRYPALAEDLDQRMGWFELADERIWFYCVAATGQELGIRKFLDTPQEHGDNFYTALGWAIRNYKDVSPALLRFAESEEVFA